MRVSYYICLRLSPSLVEFKRTSFWADTIFDVVVVELVEQTHLMRNISYSLIQFTPNAPHTWHINELVCDFFLHTCCSLSLWILFFRSIVARMFYCVLKRQLGEVNLCVCNENVLWLLIAKAFKRNSKTGWLSLAFLFLMSVWFFFQRDCTAEIERQRATVQCTIICSWITSSMAFCEKTMIGKAFLSTLFVSECWKPGVE